MEELKEDSILEIPKLILLEDLGTMFTTESSKRKYRFGIYKCGFCGTDFKANTYAIIQGKTKSCGCYQKRRASESTKTHGLIETRLYRIWADIKSRTLNINTKGFNDYGGRGITICDEWKNDVKSFYDWAITNGYLEGLSLDRIDNDGNYCPENCRWTTPTIQARNQRVCKNNKSGYKGVAFRKDNNNFRVTITVNKKGIHLGHFKTAVEGAIAYNNYIIENNLEGFILNEIPEEYLNQYIKEKN